MAKEVHIKCVGTNADDVTGSCILIETPDRKILLECGLWQSSGDTLEDYKINNEPFDFKAKQIDYVFCCHNHVDHCGRIPLLYKRGTDAPLIMPSDSRDILRILLEDSAHISASDAAELSKVYKRDYTAIYDQTDVNDAMDHLKEYSFGEKIVLDQYVAFRFTPSGHIPNSAQLELWVTTKQVTKKICYTSDLGNTHIHAHYGTEFQAINKCDILIGETTYAGETRIATKGKRNKELQKLKDTIMNVCAEQRGKILIPVFANCRLQEMLTTLYELFKDENGFRFPVIVDTPMGMRVNSAYAKNLTSEQAELWNKVREWDCIKCMEDATESRMWMKDSGPAIVLASSGMMTSGRSRAWCRELLPHSRNTIIFCGFSVDNSLASIIKSGKAKKVKLSGEWIPNRCRIVDLHTWTSHMQRDSLLEYYSDMECQCILLVHGEKDGQISFAEELRNTRDKKDHTGKVLCAHKGMEVNI